MITSSGLPGGSTASDETLRSIERMTGWSIEPRHRNTGVMRQLETFSRQLQGLPVADARLRDLMNWVAELNLVDGVIDYHHNAPPNDVCRTGGFFLRGKGPGDEYSFPVHGRTSLHSRHG